jgi:hypothetical protein
LWIQQRMKMTAFCGVASCSLVESRWWWREYAPLKRRLLLQGYRAP